MFPFHQVLSEYAPLVEMYVIDARPTILGNAVVKLTVLVSPQISEYLRFQIFDRLEHCMERDQLAQIAEDFDLVIDDSKTPSWNVVVRSYEEGVS